MGSEYNSSGNKRWKEQQGITVRQDMSLSTLSKSKILLSTLHKGTTIVNILGAIASRHSHNSGHSKAWAFGSSFRSCALKVKNGQTTNLILSVYKSSQSSFYFFSLLPCYLQSRLGPGYRQCSVGQWRRWGHSYTCLRWGDTCPG